MKFLSDEHIDIPAVEALKQIHIDIVSVQELNKRGFSDRDLLIYAKKAERVVVTRDTDFLKLHTQGAEHDGIIFITRPLTTGQIVREIEKISLIFEDLKTMVIFMPMK